MNYPFETILILITETLLTFEILLSFVQSRSKFFSLFHSGESAEHARAERVVRVREARRDLRQGQGQHDHLPPRRQEGEGPLSGLMCRYMLS